jgi:hypothetical protein
MFMDGSLVDTNRMGGTYRYSLLRRLHVMYGSKIEFDDEFASTET